MDTIEHELIDALQPIRGMALANCINHFFETGLYNRLKNRDASAEQLATELGLAEHRLTGFLLYLRNEGLLDLEDNHFRLTNRARQLNKFEAWYTMLVGGYAETYQQIGQGLKGNGQWATRNIGKVGIGSCGISYYDAIPLTRKLMRKIENPVSNLLDLGCGNALYLTEFCKQVPDITAYGVEPSGDACKNAVAMIAEQGLQDRITIINQDINTFLNNLIDFEPDLLVLGFILQEILGQEGEIGVVNFLTKITKRYPDMKLIVIEVDNQIENPNIMRHGLAQSYYNPYYLIHYFTQQRLETDEWWHNMFQKCGLEVVAKDHPDDTVDSTRLEIGYLLQKVR